MPKARLFARWVLPVICLLLVRAPAQSMFVGTPEAEPGFGLYATETGGSLLLGAAGTAGLWWGIAAMWTKPGDDIEHRIVSTIMAGVISVPLIYPVGCAAGATIVGGLNRQNGNFGAAYLGALLGLPVLFGTVWVAQSDPGANPVLMGSLMGLGFLVPPVGATIGYNLSRKSGAGYGRLDQRLLMPSVGLRGEPAGKKTVVALDMKLLTVRF